MIAQLIEKLRDYEIYILYGGTSPEREISIKTGENVYQVLKEKKLNIHLFDIKSPDDLTADFFSDNHIFFLALHGGFGEDGTLQKKLEQYKAYFTGSGQSASRIAMNKYLTKKIAESIGIKVPLYLYFSFNDLTKLNRILDFINFPLIVKPVNLGSTIGVKVCKNFNEMKDALNFIKTLDNEFLVEEFLSGEEITASVLRNKSLVPIRLKYEEEIFDYDLKYKGKKIVYEFLEKNYKSVDLIAEKVFKAIGAYSYARIDFRSDGEFLYLLEVNTLPGLTPLSLFPKSAKMCGVEFDELLLILLEDALNRYSNEQQSASQK
ncbi:MAG: D-alanine--D-alanine ligase [Planctomycetota bacterium]